MSYQHLSLTIQGSVAHIALDYHEKSANVLSQDMIAEIGQALSHLEAQDAVGGFILTSAKKSGFVFGADITEFESLRTQDEVRALQQNAMALLDRISDSPLVSVAVFHGPALGGGLELALACDYRLCREDARIMVGFPEANLGLMPGFAGTARAARLIGGAAAIEMCLSAKPITSQQILQDYGLIDGLCPTGQEEVSAAPFIKKGKRHFGDFCDASQWQDTIAKARETHLAQKIEAHTPHLAAMIAHFAEAGPDYTRLVLSELTIFPRLMLDDVSHNLRRVFALTDRVKKQARGDAGITHVQVIGAGAMGADIAHYLCLKGMHVYLCDPDEQALSRAYERAEVYFNRKLDPASARQALARFTCGLHSDNAMLIDLVIEAAPEKMAIKKEIWRTIEQTHEADCLFATNSSALDLEEISADMMAPARLMGLHFFNPATVMPLIEVIHRPSSDEGAKMRLMQFATQIGKFPIAVQNSPGFLVNRALLPYIFEAIEQMLSGVAADEIDEALLAYGMPMGPLELADQIGLDICHDVGMRLGMSEAVNQYLKDKITAQTLGRKTGSGIYEWDGKKAVRPRASYDAEMAAKLTADILTPLVSICRAVLEEGHVADADLIDAAMIYGMGYPRHTGGPLHAHKTDLA